MAVAVPVKVVAAAEDCVSCTVALVPGIGRALASVCTEVVPEPVLRIDSASTRLPWVVTPNRADSYPALAVPYRATSSRMLAVIEGLPMPAPDDCTRTRRL